MTLNDNSILYKVEQGERIDTSEAIHLYRFTPLFLLAKMATIAKKKKSGNDIFYNKNFHIEPTNICCFRCKFCSYRKDEGQEGGWNMSFEDIENEVRRNLTAETTEVHLVGGVNAAHSLERYCEVISLVRRLVGERVKIKAFSAIEHIYVFDKAGISFEEGLKRLIASGMDTITGGGAEIFASEVRSEICADKASADRWLEFHATAHRMGIKSNATMLYGHIESLEQRIDHMRRLRDLQDITGGFTTFIPLKYRSKNNSMSYLGECSVIDDMRTIAVSRIFLDNFDHVKAYSPMYGKNTTQLAILFGADDIDGTVKSSTKIYSMAGVTEVGMDEEDMISLITKTGYKAVERDTFYNKVER